MGALPFDTGYALLSRASREQITDWFIDLTQIRARPERAGALTSFFKLLVQIDSRLAKELFLQLTKEDRWTAMYAISAAAPPRAAKEVVEVLRTFDMLEISSCSHNLLNDAVGEWSDIDPEAVRQYLEESGDELRNDYRNTLMSRWAAHDPQAARQWLLQELERIANDGRDDYGPVSDRRYLLSSFVEGWFEADPVAAMDYAVSISGSEDGTDTTILPTVAAALFQRSPAEGQAFVMRVAESGRSTALRGIGWWAAGLQNAEDAPSAPPAAVAEWLLEFSAEDRTEAMEALLRHWRSRDAAELYQWINKLPAAEQLEILRDVGLHVHKETAEKELRDVLGIDNAPLRAELLRRLMRGGEQARSELGQALTQTGFTAEQQRELIALIPEKTYEVASVDEDE